MKKRQTISVLIVFFYLIITSAIGLFHDDECIFGPSNEDTTKGNTASEASTIPAVLLRKHQQHSPVSQMFEGEEKEDDVQQEG